MQNETGVDDDLDWKIYTTVNIRYEFGSSQSL